MKEKSKIEILSVNNSNKKKLIKKSLNFAKGFFQRVILSLQENEYLPDEEVKTNENEKVNMDLQEPNLGESVKGFIQMVSDLVEINQRAIGAVSSALHLEKVEKAHGDQIEWLKFQQDPNYSNLEGLRNRVSENLSALKSDIKNCVDDCNGFKIKLLFGWKEIERIRKVLEELKETLIAYRNEVLLLVQLHVVIGECVSVKITLEEERGFIAEWFPENNKMYDLTEDIFWKDEPRKCLYDFEKIIKEVDRLNKLKSNVFLQERN